MLNKIINFFKKIGFGIKDASRYFFVFGIVFLAFACLSFILDLLQGKGTHFSLYPIINGALALVLIALYIVFNGARFKSSFKERKTKYGANAIIYVVLFLGIVVFANVITVTEPTFSKKWDLTESSVFTLSDQTVKLLKNLNQDIEIIAFYNVGANEKEILKDLYESYRYYSGKVKYEFYDADENPQLAKELEVTNGMAIVKAGNSKTKIAGMGEEDLTNAIVQITKKGEKSIYFLTGHGEGDLESEEEDGYSIIKQFSENEGYSPKTLDLMKEEFIPSDCSLLVVIAPKNKFTDVESAKIGKYIDEGGNALFMMEPQFSYDQSSIVRTGLEDIISKKLGVELVDNVIFHEMQLPEVLMRLVGRQLKPEVAMEEYGMHPITNDYKRRTVFGYTRSLDKMDKLPEGVTVEEVLKIDDKTYWGEKSIATIKNRTVKPDAGDAMGKMVVGYSVEKEVKVADGKRNDKGKILVLGNASFVSNARIPGSSHLDFIMNSFNWALGEEQKISIRPKKIKSSNLTWGTEEAQTIFYIAVLLIPQLIFILGLGIWQWRRNR